MPKKMPVLLIATTVLFWSVLAFGAQASSVKTLQVAQADLAEIEFWQSVKNSKDAAELEIYLNVYPKGQFAPLAKIRLNKLKTAPASAAKATPVVVNEAVKPDKTVLGKLPSPPPAVHECDRLAANPSDPGKTTSGLTMAELVVDGATAACRSAVEKYPGVARFHYQLGRTLHKAELYKQALQSYRKAVDLNYPAGMHNIGIMYLSGWGVVKDEEKSVEWFRKAAEMGHPTAMFSIGLAYMKGLGVSKDYAMALKWYHAAAKKGHPRAMNSIGLAYDDGQGVGRDQAEAAKWFRKAAKNGYLSGMYNLGGLLDRRNYTNRNPRAAARYLLDAYKAGNKITRKALFHLHARLQTDTRRAIQRNLRAAGVYSGPIDSKFGSSTLSALLAFKAKFSVNAQTAGGRVLKNSSSAKKTDPEAIVTQADANATCKKAHGSGAIAQAYMSFGKQNHVCICAKSHNWNSEGTLCIKQ